MTTSNKLFIAALIVALIAAFADTSTPDADDFVLGNSSFGIYLTK